MLRTDTSGDPSFAELLDRVRETNLAAYAHQDVPFERLVEIVNPTRSLAHHPLFQVMLTFEATRAELPLAGFDSCLEQVDAKTSKFDLEFGVEELHTVGGVPNGVTGWVDFATDLFDQATVEAMTARLERLLRAVTTDPARPLDHITLLTDDEHHKLTHTWPATTRTLPTGETLPDHTHPYVLDHHGTPVPPASPANSATPHPA